MTTNPDQIILEDTVNGATIREIRERGECITVKISPAIPNTSKQAAALLNNHALRLNDVTSEQPNEPNDSGNVNRTPV